MPALPALAFSLLLLSTAAQGAGISVVDDAGATVTLQQPARRILTLAPHAAELVHAAGAGAYLIGVSEYSNFPASVKSLPSVGSSSALDIERILALKPDLVVAWTSGNSAQQIARLKRLGLPIYQSEVRDFEVIATSLERLARLAGTEQEGRSQAGAFRQRWQSLAARYQERPAVRVFYQIWRAPLMTVNDAHIVSQALHLCGGKNIFGHLPHLAPTVSMEAVVEADPQAIMTTSGENDPLAAWQRFPQLAAVRDHNLFTLDPDLMHRPTPRMLEGVQTLCEQLEVVRTKDSGIPKRQ